MPLGGGTGGFPQTRQRDVSDRWEGGVVNAESGGAVAKWFGRRDAPEDCRLGRQWEKITGARNQQNSAPAMSYQSFNQQQEDTSEESMARGGAARLGRFGGQHIRRRTKHPPQRGYPPARVLS